MNIESAPAAQQLQPYSPDQDFGVFWGVVATMPETLRYSLERINRLAGEAFNSSDDRTAYHALNTDTQATLDMLFEEGPERDALMPSNAATLAAYTILHAAMDGEPVGPYDLLRFREERGILNKIKGRKVLSVIEMEPGLGAGDYTQLGEANLVTAAGRASAYLDVFLDPQTKQYDCSLMYDVPVQHGPHIANDRGVPRRLRLLPDELQ